MEAEPEAPFFTGKKEAYNPAFFYPKKAESISEAGSSYCTFQACEIQS